MSIFWTIQDNKAKLISAELLGLNLKNKLDETGEKQEETGRNKKKWGWGTEKLQKNKEN